MAEMVEKQRVVEDTEPRETVVVHEHDRRDEPARMSGGWIALLIILLLVVLFLVFGRGFGGGGGGTNINVPAPSTSTGP